MKLCFRCKETKNLDQFHVDRSRKDGRHTYCKNCNNKIRIGRQSPNHKTNNKKYYWGTRREAYQANPAAYLWRIAKKRAAHSGIEFTITEADIEVPTVCPILGCKIDVLTNSSITGASLDRVNNTRGYVKGNIAVISRRANRMKSDMSVTDLKAIIAYIEKYRDN